MREDDKPDHIPSIAAAMTPFPWVVRIDRPLREARTMMRSHGIRHLPVIDGDMLVGVLSDRDVEFAERASPDFDRLTVRDACGPEAYVVDMSAPLDVVLGEMANGRIESALVTRDGKIAGIFTSTDACRRFSEFLKKMFPEPGDDELA